MKRLLIIALLVVAGIFNLSAQETQIDLSKYKLPNMKRQMLEFDFDFGNYFNKEYYSNNEGDLSKSNRSSTGLDIYYSYYKNSLKWQQEIYVDFEFGAGIGETREYGEIDYSNSNLGSDISLNSINRYYLGDFFWGLNPQIDARYSQGSYKFYGSDSKGYGSSFDAYIPVHFGYGRIERVEDARQGAYIYNALIKKARAIVGKSEDDLLILAEKISQLKNKRFFDARKKKIYELEELDKFLKENGFVDESDITYFATLEDMWEYGNTPYRYSGLRASVFVNPGYHVDEEVERAGNDKFYLEKYYLLKTGISIDYEKPLNMYWQNSLSFQSFYGISRNRTIGRYNVRNDWRTPGIHIGLSESIGFYPNTRTNFSTSTGIYLVKHLDKPKNEDSYDDYVGSFKGQSLYFNARLSGYYYFSPQLRMTGLLSFYYVVNVVRDNYTKVNYYNADSDGWNTTGNFLNAKNSFNYNLSLRFEYFLF